MTIQKKFSTKALRYLSIQAVLFLIVLIFENEALDHTAGFILFGIFIYTFFKIIFKFLIVIFKVIIKQIWKAFGKRISPAKIKIITYFDLCSLVLTSVMITLFSVSYDKVSVELDRIYNKTVIECKSYCEPEKRFKVTKGIITVSVFQMYRDKCLSLLISEIITGRESYDQCELTLHKVSKTGKK